MAVNRSDIIQQLYNDKDIRQAIGKMQPVELQDDLRQEMFLVLCEMSEDRLLTMYENGFLKFYLVRTMLSMIKSDRSTFFKTFRRGMDEWTGQKDLSDNFTDDYEMMVFKMEKGLSVLHWYEKEIFKLYADNRMNIMEVSRLTKIPYRSLSMTIKKVKTYLYYKVRNSKM